MPTARARGGRVTAYDHVWRVKTRPLERLGQTVGDRKGQRCRVLCFGALNSCLVEFDDGSQFVTCRYYVRRVP